jgi:hypothetical protein
VAFRKRRARKAEAAAAKDAPQFRHASGRSDLMGVLGDHTLDAEAEKAAVWPKGSRARSIAKDQSGRR